MWVQCRNMYGYVDHKVKVNANLLHWAKLFNVAQQKSEREGFVTLTHVICVNGGG